MPAAAAMLRRLEWVAFGGFSRIVVCTTFSTCSAATSGLTRDGLLAFLMSRYTPLARWRRRERRIVSTLLPTVRPIATAVKPSPANSTIRARQTTFWGILRSRNNRSRPAALIEIGSILLIGVESQVRADCKSSVNDGTLGVDSLQRGRVCII